MLLWAHPTSRSAFAVPSAWIALIPISPWLTLSPPFGLYSNVCLQCFIKLPIQQYAHLIKFFLSSCHYLLLLLRSLQSCPTLCDSIYGSPPGSPVPGILQARTLEWVAISLSNAWKWKVKVKSLSRVQLFETPWTAAYQALLSMGFSRREYWSRVPLPSPCHYLTHYKFYLILCLLSISPCGS